MIKIRIGIYGAASISAGKLFEILLRHPHAEIKWAISETLPGKKVCSTHHQLGGRTDLEFSKFEEHLLDEIDVVFSCKRPTETFGIIDSILRKGIKLIDLSADYRLKNREDFKTWYGKEHTKSSALSLAVYGMPEFYRNQIRYAQIIANPGCYTTASILACAPFAKAGFASYSTITVDAVSGVSGAGRAAKEENLFINVDSNVRTYRVGTHQHTPEIEQELRNVAGHPVKVLFVPHVGPFYSGILADCFFKLSYDAKMPTDDEAYSILASYYHKEPFIRVLPQGTLPQIANVLNTNFCEIGVTTDARTNTVCVFSAIDNLVKGASGQAIHNMNIMFGLPETTALF